jgi:hypothetical protein
MDCGLQCCNAQAEGKATYAIHKCHNDIADP